MINLELNNSKMVAKIVANLPTGIYKISQFLRGFLIQIITLILYYGR